MIEGPKEYIGHVYLVDDDDALRESLCAVLKNQQYRVQEFASATEFLQLHSRAAPAVLLLDMRLPGISGVELQSRLAAAASDVPIVFMSGQCRSIEMIDALKGGAVDFLVKPFGVEALLASVGAALQLHAERQQQRLLSQKILDRYQTLTEREREVAGLLVQGFANYEIAGSLGIAPATVKIHKQKALGKMQVATAVHLRIAFEDAGLLESQRSRPGRRGE